MSVGAESHPFDEWLLGLKYYGFMVQGAARTTGVGLAVLTAIALLPGSVSAEPHHEVRAGQSLALIAHHYHVDVFDLAAHNHMRPSDPLRPGQFLDIPSKGITYVRPGWSLGHIAKAHGVTVKELMRANHIEHPSDLKAYQRLVLPGYRAALRRARDRDWGSPDEPGVVKMTTYDNSEEIRLRDANGNVPRDGLKELGKLMMREVGGADGDDDVRMPKPRLALLLADISDHFGGRPIRLVSGFRYPRGWTRQSSRHVHGAATDIRVQGVPRRILWDYCRSLNHTGCGFYPHSFFVHVDVRMQNAQWVDWSRPGHRPHYGTLRGRYGRHVPRSHRRHVGRRVTHPDEVPLHVTVVDEPVLPNEQQAQKTVASADGHPTS